MCTRSGYIATSLGRPGPIAAAPESTLTQPAIASVKNYGLGIDYNGVSGPSQDPMHRVTEITLRPISIRFSFLVATIQAVSDSVGFSHSEPATLLSEVLGQGGKIEGVTLKPMPLPGLWMMTGFLRNRVDLRDASALPAGGETRQAPTDDMCHSSNLEERARVLCSLAGNAKAGEMEE
jgi:hypothetical protein